MSLKSLEGRSQRIIKELSKQGEVRKISNESVYQFEQELATAFSEIKEESYRKNRTYGSFKLK